MSNPIFAEHGVENILGLDENRHYHYQILSFVIGHRMLGIHVYEKGEYGTGYYLHFRNVFYLDAPIEWHGSTFRTAPRNEYMTLVQELWSNNQTDGDEDIPSSYDDYALFEAIDDKKRKTRILAHRGVLVFSNWEDYVESFHHGQRKKLLERISLTDSNTPVIRYTHGRGLEDDLEVAELLEILARGYPAKEGYGVKSEDIQAALLFASGLIKKTYGSHS